MTRDEYLLAISQAFDNVHTEAMAGAWNVQILTTPRREIFINESFLQKNVFGGEMTVDQLTAHIQSVPNNQWVKQKDGSLILAI